MNLRDGTHGSVHIKQLTVIDCSQRRICCTLIVSNLRWLQMSVLLLLLHLILRFSE